MKEPLLSYIDAYRLLLDMCSSGQINKKINNDHFEHSSSVYERFFLDCHNDITILARGIKEQIFNVERVKNAAKKFVLEENTKLNFILREKDDSDAEKILNSGFITHIKHVLSEACLENKVTLTFYEGGDDWLNDTPSVTVGDDRMYRQRYCKDKSQITKTGKAIVNFGDKENVSKIRENISKKIEKLTVSRTINI